MTALPTARGLFRQLIRARAVAFRGDQTALAAWREEIRKHFQVSERQHGPTLNLPHLFQPNLPPNPFQSTKDSAHLGPEEAKKKIEEGVEAESFIRLHVVQAQVNDKGNYEMSVEPQHVDRTMPGENIIESPDGGGGCSSGKKE